MKTVVLSFPARVNDDYSGIHADRRTFLDWDWSGDEEVEAVLEIIGYIPGRSGYPIGRVRYTPGDAAALLPTLRLAERVFVADYEAMERDKAAKQSAKRFLPRLPPVQPAKPEQVPPSLRFMLEPEAMSEADAFYKRLDILRGPGFSRLADGLPGAFPRITRVDEILGGALSRLLRLTSDVSIPPGEFVPAKRPAVALANGRPDIVAESARDATEETLKRYKRRETVSGVVASPIDDCPF